ncbi:LytR cell envelope-related transcriptional attenuator [Bifidobacterium goeldii]|uniref:LytR cell envelope-related transcriptional attenuator n=1 Tax=Bifidobacterium goeldii TaxID=2306975 RepID=A0A430FJT6_9BIFI|nr:LytR C-terminal domain-containing protein [Bifidobacterium goeldii]RSX53139.1 LytR cell envelope-related transcriptional attenuator [Bifidobacterium goeldii]
MAKDKETYTAYPKDVFDNPPAGPVGVHRGAKSVGARLAPFLAVLIIVAVIGVGVWGVFSGTFGEMMHLGSSSSQSQSSSSNNASSKSNTDTSDTKDSTNSSDTADQSDTSSSDTSSSDATNNDSSAEQNTDQNTDQTDQNNQTDTQQTTPEQTQTANKATMVRVVNGTKISGHAASKSYVLQQAGYTNVVAANPSGSLPSSTVVWYQNETDLATAKDVAATLGISNVAQVSDLSAPVVVVLMQ